MSVEGIPNEAQLTKREQERRQSTMEVQKKRMQSRLYISLLSEMFLVETMLLGKPPTVKKQLTSDLEQLWKNYGKKISVSKAMQRVPYFGRPKLTSQP